MEEEEEEEEEAEKEIEEEDEEAEEELFEDAFTGNDVGEAAMGSINIIIRLVKIKRPIRALPIRSAETPVASEFTILLPPHS